MAIIEATGRHIVDVAAALGQFEPDTCLLGLTLVLTEPAADMLALPANDA